MPETDRAILDRTTRELDAKRIAAEELWASGSSAEAIRLAQTAVDDFAASGDSEAQFDALMAEITRRMALPPTVAEVRSQRRTRWVITVLLALSVMTFVFLEATRKPKPPTARASSSWDVRYPAENVVDGSDATDWLLPDTTRRAGSSSR